MCGACSGVYSCSSAMVDTVNEVEEREEKNPDDVDEVPVEAHDLDGAVVLGAEIAAPRPHDHPDQEAGADDHVQRVQAGHAPVKRHEELHLRRERGHLVPCEVRAGEEAFVEMLP